MREGRGDEEEPCGWRDCLSGTARLLWLLRILIGEMMISTGIGSPAAARLERYTKQVTAMRPPFANAVIAAAIASALAIAPPTLAASGSRSGGPVGGPGSVGQKDAAVSPAKTSHAKATGGHRVSGASSSGPAAPSERRAGIAAARHPVGPDMVSNGAGMAERCRPY